MLRIDAEENDCPELILTLTSVDPFTDAGAYREWCAQLWRKFRKRYGAGIEYCGFIEWTTGEAPRSGGHRRLHSHWLVKLRGATVDPVEAQAFISAEWKRMSGAWRVELAELRSAGGIIGYLALHHEKLSQRPPEGWTGRRLRPSKGYFSEIGEIRRARARLWLAVHRDQGAHELPQDPGRIVWRTGTHSDDQTAAATARIVAQGPTDFNSLPERVALDRRLVDPENPVNQRRADPLQAAADDHDALVKRWLLAKRARARERVLRRRSASDG